MTGPKSPHILGREAYHAGKTKEYNPFTKGAPSSMYPPPYELWASGLQNEKWLIEHKPELEPKP